MHCIFCEINARKIDSKIIYENDTTMVILDIADDADGHMLVISKKHYTNILDCPGNVLAEVMSTVQLISRHCVEHCGFDGVNLLNANGEAADQSVGHFHIHIIPRKVNDKVEAWPSLSKPKYTKDEMYELLKFNDNHDTSC